VSGSPCRLLRRRIVEPRLPLSRLCRARREASPGRHFRARARCQQLIRLRPPHQPLHPLHGSGGSGHDLVVDERRCADGAALEGHVLDFPTPGDEAPCAAVLRPDDREPDPLCNPIEPPHDRACSSLHFDHPTSRQCVEIRGHNPGLIPTPTVVGSPARARAEPAIGVSTRCPAARTIAGHARASRPTRFPPIGRRAGG